jgi:DNA polymerase I-like protein with 3'-5' exonuclease and polymerase domains
MGLFWDEDANRSRAIGPMPPIPETGWRPPTTFPDLRTATAISLDTETFDPELKKFGPGWARGKGHIVGISVAVDPRNRWYFPMRHEVEAHDNLDPAHVLAWARDQLGGPQPKIGANLYYDVGWLAEEGVEVRGPLFDVQFGEALLTEDAPVAVEALAYKYLGERKETELLYRWCAAWYGGKPNESQRANIYRSPPRLVGPYAEKDADIPLRVLYQQWPLMREQDLLPVFDMECRLIRLMIAMRFAGVTVDLEHAERTHTALGIQIADDERELYTLAGIPINVNSGQSIARAFDKFSIHYPRTEDGNPSFQKDFLKSVEHPIAKRIANLRELIKLRSTFIESYIFDANVNGKVYGQFNLLRGTDDGARSGRLSSSKPNLQNIPKRNKKIAPLLRGIFIPDAGHLQWRKYDYSQIEYRFLAHFAVGRGSEELRQAYQQKPDTDYHQFVQDMVQAITSILLDREPTKNINFGLLYGMGVPKLLRMLGIERGPGLRMFDAYHAGAPYVQDTMDATADEANRLGYVTTILGRRSRFDFWVPSDYNENAVPLPLEQAVRQYGTIKRAYLHKAINRRLQGSAADKMKLAMLLLWDSGLLAQVGVPRLTVHDELDFSDPGGLDREFVQVREILQTAIPLRVPVLADCEIGPNWGNVKEIVA